MRSGWLRRVGPWVGIGTSPAAIMTGGGVGQGLRGAELVAALLTGTVALAAIALAQGLLGQRTGRTLASLTAGPLGERGSRRTASVVMLLMMLGWYGVNVGVAGVALGRLLAIPDLAGIALFSVAMLGVAALGLGVLSWSSLVAGLATTALAAYGLHLAFADHPVTLSGGHSGEQPIGFVAAVALVVGYGAAFSLRTPDFTNDLRHARDVLWCALVGLLVPVTAFALAGAALQAVTGTFDLADVLRRLGSPEAAYLFIALGFTGSVLTNVWSGALSLTDALPGVPARLAQPLVAAVGAVAAALGLAEHMLPWLTIIALAAPGLVVLCVMHAIRGGTVSPGWGVPGLASWVAGFACGLGLYLAGSPVALPVAALVPALAYRVLARHGEDHMTNAKAEG
jgi:cytosine permease